MHTNKVTLSNMLSSQRQHIIPVFQRSYSWSRKNWNELWLDIVALISEEDKSYEHFLGPMIIDHGDTGSYVPEKYLVIDGQQRLVTLSVFLCAIRDFARQHDIESLAASVQEHLTFRTPDGDVEQRLTPRSADRVAFERVLSSSITAQDSKQQIVKAYRFFARQIKQYLEANGHEISEVLKDLFTVAIARLKFVSITLEAKDDPTKVYESMNSRGQALLVADLIRNYVLMHLPGGKVQDRFYTDEWEAFERLFSNAESGQPDAKELEDFYYRYLISLRSYFAKRLVYSTYKQQLSDFVNASDSIDSKIIGLKRLVEDQKRYAIYYRRIVHPELEPDKQLRDAFERFGFLDTLTATPFIMALYARYDENGSRRRITKAQYLEMMNALESFIIRRSVMRLRTRGYGLDFAQAINRSDSIGELREHFQVLEWPDDDTIRETLVEFPLYLRERKKARLILEQLESAFGHKEPVDLSNREIIQIEHIMPQNKDLSPAWSNMLGEHASDTHAAYRHTLGNLTLTGYNRELGSKSFQDKKAEYAKHGTGSHLELNAYVLAQDQWTEKEIIKRAQMLIERFIEIWPRPDTP